MGKSLYLSCDNHMEYIFTMDNLIIVKIMNDFDMPLPEHLEFSNDCNGHNSLFFTSCSLLFDSDFEYRDGDKVVYPKVKLVEEWQKLKMEHGALLEEEEEWILEPVQECMCDFFATTFELRISEKGILIETWDGTGVFHSFLENVLEFHSRLEYKISQWRSQDAQGNGNRSRGNKDFAT